MIFKLIEKYSSEDKPPVIIGYTYLVFEKVLSLLEKTENQVKCPKGTTFIHFGGWKKLKERKISKKNLNKLITKHLGITNSNIIDIYGFTEQLGTVYPGFGDEGCLVSAY